MYVVTAQRKKQPRNVNWDIVASDAWKDTGAIDPSAVVDGKRQRRSILSNLKS
jgi:hypothetical protein